MIQLKQNSRIRLEDGRDAIVEHLFGEGAQGAVYSVMVDGERKALKWFRRKPSEGFLKNIRKNISNGAPSHHFLWPEALTKQRDGSMGYIMPLKAEDSYEFSKFRLAKVRFTSFRAILEAAKNLCDAFRLLHAQGLSYQDLNDGGFFINPETGAVNICDCDNVYPHGENSGILGKARYMAPEVVMGKSLPNSYTDRFSLTVILFMLFCIDHPFEGFNVVKRPCLTEEIERQLFGKDILFVYDRERADNRPVRGVHHNLLMIWPLLPASLRDAFIEQFSRRIIDNPQERMTEMQWIKLLTSVSDRLVRCPVCGDEMFVDGNSGRCINPRCKRSITATFNLEGGGHQYPLISNNQIKNDDGSRFGLVVAKPGQPDTQLIKNVSTAEWMIETPSGKTITIAPGAFMPVKANLKISGNSIKFTIKNL